MSNNETFTILSVGAPLVEVDGSGPTTDRAGGLTVPNGVPTIAPVHLLTEFVRRWRVDGPLTAQATVRVTDSPFGVFVGLRRCAQTRPAKSWHRFTIVRWPWLRDALKRRTPSLLALWHLFTDNVQPCNWQNIGDNDGEQVTARGGDLVVVTFVVP